MYSKRNRNYKLSIKHTILIAVFIIISFTNCTFAASTDSVNVLTWWGYLDAPEITRIVKDNCNVNMSHDTYYTNNEFLRRVKTNKTHYDIVIFSQTIYDLVKNQIPNNQANLNKFSDKFNPVIKKEYLKSKFPHNVIYFMHSLSGFLWNPKKITLSDQDNVREIFKKANDNSVVLINDPLEIWNLINTAEKSTNDHITRNYSDSVMLTLKNLKRLTQNTKVYIANNYNQIYDQDDFAFAFGWTGDAIVYMKQAHKKYNFLIHPNLSYISSDLMAAMNSNPKTMCVANTLMSKKVLDIIQNNTYYFSPYGDYQSVDLPIYQTVYREVFKKLSQIQWIESSLTSSDFEKLADAWNDIQLNIQSN